MTSQCLISFGSNLGQRESVIADAARRIAGVGGIGELHASRLFQTPPIGGPGGQEPFLNAVAAFETTLSARDVLEILQATEQELGRRRLARWGARSIDLDVVLHGALVGGSQGLIVPHPRYTARLFVLQPACDVAGHYRDPRFGWTLQQLTDHVTAAPPSLALVGVSLEIRLELCRRLSREYGVQTFYPGPLAEPMAVRGNAPAAVRSPARSPSFRGSSSSESAPSDPVNSSDPVHPANSSSDFAARGPSGRSRGDAIEPREGEPWVAAFIPPLPPLDSRHTSDPRSPRLVARLQRTTPETRWPAPHLMWPAGWRWPEYRLEIDQMDWAVQELASALESMRCPLDPVTQSGDWWQ